LFYKTFKIKHLAFSNLTQLFEGFQELQVLVVGDVMLDRYLYGNVTRISPEAPVPIVEWASEESRLGGAANVALNLKNLGAAPFLLGVVGQDLDGEHFFDLMPQAALQNQWLISCPERRTTVKTRVMAGNQQLLRLDKEQTDALPKASQLKLLQKFLEVLEQKPIHTIIIQDYDKGTLTPFLITEILAEAKKRGIPVAVDPKFRNFWAYKGVDLFKPNLKEVKDALKMAITPHEASLRHASQLIREKLGNKTTFITLSEHGSYIDDENQGLLLPTLPRNVADVCGAGDTVISIAALALALGLPNAEIALLANLAGGQVVEKSGVASVDPAQLKNELLQLQMAGQLES
jgi:rfaE bifunctional protein kinase chain/domain